MTSSTRPTITIAVILLIGFTLRVAHLLASIDNPFLYALSPDEDYYLAFGRDVATGGLGLDPAFAFMDPLYGYLLGALIVLTGENLFVIRLLQIAVDCSSIALVAHIATTLAGRRAGLLAGGLYALASPAVFYATLILKTTLVANIVLIWIAVALRALTTQRITPWLALGVVTGIAALLRSNLILLLPGALLLALPFGTRSTGRSLAAALAVLVTTLALQIPAGLRHQAITGDFALLPSNGGIVLYQVYAPDHLDGGRVMPAFVESVNPLEMQYYFVQEAQRRTGREMSLDDANAYWGSAAVAQIREQPAAALKHIADNLQAFVGGLEIPNNRSLYVDRAFSLPLALSPVGFAILAGLGVPGLVGGISRRPAAAVLLIPIAIAMITIAVFFDFSRFRFPALPCLAVAGGLFLDHLMT
ncbi:MAG: hypothetical protein HKO62_11720, partial [Gammaproteobacteria bacterium]|nr:hypothetical protein [Gammaproteobacteria bacterium]